LKVLKQTSVMCPSKEYIYIYIWGIWQRLLSKASYKEYICWRSWIHFITGSIAGVGVRVSPGSGGLVGAVGPLKDLRLRLITFLSERVGALQSAHVPGSDVHPFDVGLRLTTVVTYNEPNGMKVCMLSVRVSVSALYTLCLSDSCSLWAEASRSRPRSESFQRGRRQKHHGRSVCFNIKGDLLYHQVWAWLDLPHCYVTTLWGRGGQTFCLRGHIWCLMNGFIQLSTSWLHISLFFVADDGDIVISLILAQKPFI